MLVRRPPDESDDDKASQRRQALALSDQAVVMVRGLARRFARHRQDIPDYEMAGTMGLLIAAQRFDFSKPLTRGTVDATFAAFAYVYAVHEMSDLAHQDQTASRHAMEYVSRLRRAGENPDEDRVTSDDHAQARRLGMRPETVYWQRVRIAAGEARNRPMPDDERTIDAASPSAETEALPALLEGEVRAAVAELPDNERRAFSMLLDGLPRRVIARRLGVTERSVGNYLASARKRLQTTLAHMA